MTRRAFRKLRLHPEVEYRALCGLTIANQTVFAYCLIEKGNIYSKVISHAPAKFTNDGTLDECHLHIRVSRYNRQPLQVTANHGNRG